MKITLEKVKEIIQKYYFTLNAHESDDFYPIYKAVKNNTLEIVGEEQVKGEDLNEIVFDGVKYITIQSENPSDCAFNCVEICPIGNVDGFCCHRDFRKDKRGVVLKKKED